MKVKISESRNITTLNVPPLKEESANSIDTGDGKLVNPLSPHDALKHHFISLKIDRISNENVSKTV